jgi:hypothetical protein
MVVLNVNYAKDKDRAYFLGYPLPGSDGATFHVTGDDLADDRTGRYHGYLRETPAETAEWERMDAVAKQVRERRAQRAADVAAGKP